jgi:hypothetical protein
VDHAAHDPARALRPPAQPGAGAVGVGRRTDHLPAGVGDQADGDADDGDHPQRVVEQTMERALCSCDTDMGTDRRTERNDADDEVDGAGADVAQARCAAYPCPRFLADEHLERRGTPERHAFI